MAFHQRLEQIEARQELYNRACFYNSQTRCNYLTFHQLI
jgi:hypothetical protein